MFQCLPLIEERLGSSDTKIEIVASIHKQESVTSPVTAVASAAAAATDTFDLNTDDHAVGIRSSAPAVTAASAATRTTVTQTFVGNVTHIRCPH